jgi:tetratricopeptide (TPR) repeat protein
MNRVFIPFRRVFLLEILILVLLFGIVGNASSSSIDNLGEVEFKTSGSKKAQQHFLHGIAALHSFWYKEALDAFRKSTEIDPNFAMGYWGEAMAHNHPLWEEQDIPAAKKVLLNIPDNAKTSPREKEYLKAVNLLYGEGDKKSRDEAYSKAMDDLHQKFPGDLEAACFYALSLLGSARGAENKFHMNVRAGAIGLEIFRKKPNHPCAAHYTIHAFDHPDLAILALPAARRYAQIAPASHHAQHMPAHIFVQLGMWSEAAKANKEGWMNSIAWVEREGLSKDKRGYHSLQWLHYVLLQQGRWKEANQILQIKINDMEEASSLKISKYYDRMIGASVFERESWESADSIIDPPGVDPVSYTKATLSFIRGFAAAVQGKPESDQYLTELKKIRSEGVSGNYFKKLERLDIWILDIQAAILVSKKDYMGAINLMDKAIAIVEKLPAPSGPPRIIKPTYELFGEILLKAGQAEKAIHKFKVSLSRHPNRARSLLGIARAYKILGKKKDANEQYSKFLSIWQLADTSHNEIREAKDYISKVNTP